MQHQQFALKAYSSYTPGPIDSSSSSSSHSLNDYGRYKRTRKSPQIADVPTTLQPLGPLIRHLLYILIMWCNNHQRIQAPNRRWKPGPLTGRLMKYLDYFRRSYVLSLRRKTLLQNQCQELST